MGVVESALVTEKEQLDILLALFVAVHPTYTVSRLLKLIGLVTLHDWLRIPELAATLLTLYETDVDADMPLVGDVTMLDGQVIVGAGPSATVNGKLHVLTFPALSVALHVTVVVVNTVNRVVPESGQTILAIPDPSVALTLEAKLTLGSRRPSVACVVYV